MLAGEKPFAMFCDADGHCDHFPAALFRAHVKSGLILERWERYKTPGCAVDIICLYYALPAEAWRIDEAHAIQSALICGCRPPSEEDDIRMGRLLGYSKEQIQAFLSHIRNLRTTSAQALVPALPAHIG